MSQPWNQSPSPTWPPPAPSPPAPGYAPPPRRHGRFSPWLIVGLAALVAASALELSASIEESTNGVVTDCSYLNISPYLFGPLAMLAGLIAVLRRRRQPAREQMHLVLGLVCLTIGTLQLVGTIAGANVTINRDTCEVGGPADIDSGPSISPLP
jgi:hypothetical protein